MVFVVFDFHEEYKRVITYVLFYSIGIQLLLEHQLLPQSLMEELF